jgi:hypothetical protein
LTRGEPIVACTSVRECPPTDAATLGDVPDGWDEIIGKHVLVGMTYVDGDGTLIEQRQKHGVVVSADDEAVYIRLAGSGEEFWLPPDLASFQEAEEGEYRLRETGEVVVDPDFVASWTIHPGPGR